MRTKNRLSKTQIEYLYIIHAIWSLCAYYASLFGIDPWDDPTEIPVEIREICGITFLLFSFPYLPSLTDCEHSEKEMAKIMQKFLQYRLLPEKRNLPLYVGGASMYDIMEPLYIERVMKHGEWLELEVVYVDNPYAFSYVKRRRKQQ